MSFIYDDENLIFDLLKSLAADVDKRVKNGQLATDPNVNMEYKNYLNLSNKLVDGLQQNYFPAPADPNSAEVSAPADADMKIYDMNSFGNFLQFIAKNQVAVNGQRVAYLNTEQPPDKKKWLPVDAERSLFVETQNEQGDRSAVQGEYFVNRDLLSKYMASLSEKISKEEPEVQRMMKTLLGGLVEKSNALLGTKNTVDHVQQAKSSAYSSSDILGYFPQALDAKRYNEDGPVPLTWGDIQSAETIRGWVNSKNISVTVPGKDGGPLGVNHPEFDFCVVARVLYGKATWLQRTKATNPELTQRYADFAKKMSEVAPQLQGPDGKSCSLTAGQSANQSGQQGGDQAGEGGLSTQTVNNILSNLPFVEQNIDFDRIERFFEAVSPLVAHNPRAASLMTNTRSLMTQVNGITTGGPFNLGININQFANMMKDFESRGKYVYGVMQLLNRILDNTRLVVDIFYGMYSTKLDRFNQQATSLVQGQIGRNSNDSSVYRNNSDDLEELRRSGTPVTK